jgi:DDE superfamily endonuclease
MKPRMLISDGFTAHETLEALEFCFKNNIILARLPSHTSHKLQPCDVAVFPPLKTAYRDQAERLERAGTNTIGKEHFTSLYSPARERAMTKKNIPAGWAKAGLYLLNPERVLRDIAKPGAVLTIPKADEVKVRPRAQYEALRTPLTPVSGEALTSLLNMIKQVPDDEANKSHKERLQKKVNNAALRAFPKDSLQQDHIQFLIKMNDESKPRRSTKSVVLGKAKVMSYEDLKEAREKRAARDAAAPAKPKRGRKHKSGPEAEPTVKGKRGRKRKSVVESDEDESDEDEPDPEPQAKVARMSEAPEPKAPRAWMSEAQEYRAPEARMRVA